MTQDIQTNAEKSSETFNSAGDTNVERQSRKLENHRKLLAAARKLFTKQGTHQTTTNDIAVLAGVAPATFYSHFKDKTDCYIAFLDDVENELCQVMEWHFPSSLSNESPASIIRLWLTANLSYSAACPGIVNALMSDTRILSKSHRRGRKMPLLGKKLIALVEMWKQTNQVTPDFDTVCFFDLVQGVVRQGAHTIERNPRSEKMIIREMARFIIRAIEAK